MIRMTNAWTAGSAMQEIAFTSTLVPSRLKGTRLQCGLPSRCRSSRPGAWGSQVEYHNATMLLLKPFSQGSWELCATANQGDNRDMQDISPLLGDLERSRLKRVKVHHCRRSQLRGRGHRRPGCGCQRQLCHTSPCPVHYS